MFPEDAGEMRLCLERCPRGDFDQRQIGVAQQILGALDPLPQDVDVRRLPDRLLEHACEMTRTHVHRGGELVDGDYVSDMLLDECQHAIQFVRWQADTGSGLRIDAPIARREIRISIVLGAGSSPVEGVCVTYATLIAAQRSLHGRSRSCGDTSEAAGAMTAVEARESMAAIWSLVETCLRNWTIDRGEDRGHCIFV